MYTVDFTITDNHSYISQDISTYQSTTEGTGGQIKGVLGYSNNGTKSLESFIFAEMYRNNIPNQSEHDEGFSFLFGPPTNNGTHYENGTRYEGVLTEIKISNDGYYGYEGPRHKAVFDKVP